MGEPYTRQHYVPKFLLKQWHSGADNSLTKHHRVRGEFVCERATANQVGFERHLYSYLKPGGQMDTAVERDFMGPFVDDPAAKAHRAMLAGGIDALDEDLRGYWAQFMVSLYLRVPMTMDVLHEKARAILGRHLDDDPDFGRQYDPGTTTRQWVDKYYPEAYAEVAVNVLPHLIQSDNLFAQMIKGHWEMRTLRPGCRFDLVVADHALLYAGALDAAFLLIVPLSPRCAFINYDTPNTWANVCKASDAQFTRAVNGHSVRFAQRYVYASDNRHAAFVDKHLRR